VLQQAQIRTAVWSLEDMELLEQQLHVKHPNTQKMVLEATGGSKLQSTRCVFSPSKFKVSPGMYHLHLITEFEISMCLLKTARRVVIIFLSYLWTGVLREYCQNLNCILVI
jgi:hypothetical protein